MSLPRSLRWVGVVLLSAGLLLAMEYTVRVLRPGLYDHPVRTHPSYHHTLTPNYRAEMRLPWGYTIRMHNNSLGMAQPEEVTIPKPAGSHRVLVVGDSFVQGLNRPASLPFIVGEVLRQRRTAAGLTIEVINGGQGSYSPLLYLARLQHQGLQLEPDAIMLLPDLTDVFDDYHRYRLHTEYDQSGRLVRVAPGGRLLKEETARRAAGFYATNSYLVKALSNLAARLPAGSGADPYGPDSNEYLFAHAREHEDQLSAGRAEEIRFAVSNLERLVDWTRRRGLPLSVVMYPHLTQIVPENTVRSAGVPRRLNRAFEHAVERLCREAHVPFRSFYGEIAARVQAGERLYFDGDMHFNESGFLRLGEFIATWVTNQPREAIGVELSPAADR